MFSNSNNNIRFKKSNIYVNLDFNYWKTYEFIPDNSATQTL